MKHIIMCFTAFNPFSYKALIG